MGDVTCRCGGEVVRDYEVGEEVGLHREEEGHEVEETKEAAAHNRTVLEEGEGDDWVWGEAGGFPEGEGDETEATENWSWVLAGCYE